MRRKRFLLAFAAGLGLVTFCLVDHFPCSRAPRSLSDAQCMALRGGLPGDCHQCVNRDYCDPSEKKCQDYTPQGRTVCLRNWEIENVDGLQAWACVETPGYTECDTTDFEVCRKDFDCKYTAARGCHSLAGGGVGYSYWTECTDKDGTHN
ncbi:MAG: hypothetical protein JSU94_17935 [Phycisphaerales bacterium]|nr:MAG: hypothetical protein JSU94_17935 [Phycisphaerales bacterium]